MIDKMALLYSSSPSFKTLSNPLTDLEWSCYNHFITCMAIDPFLGFLCG